jgi:DNA-binding response OmpR family regulator
MTDALLFRSASQPPQTRALVVDDVRDEADFLSIELQRHGFDVATSTDFRSAHRQLLSNPFDILVCDVRLGAFNGLQLAVIARAESPTMRIVVVSGFNDSVLKAEAAAINAAYLVKPIDSEHLITTLEGMTRLRGRLGAVGESIPHQESTQS